MKRSPRARRMARNHKRLAQAPKLNLVSLMDIFTILVFFLMVNNGDVEVLTADKEISLPESVSEQRPDATLTIKVGEESIIVQGREVGLISEALAQDGNTLAALDDELEYQATRTPLQADQSETGRSVIIMGDENMPYLLLKRIMSTCAARDYRDISLAVNSSSPASDANDLVASGGW